ncbi:MAG TPA: TlpA disulfide reductase family protein [Flavisolibacter sp.]
MVKQLVTLLVMLSLLPRVLLSQSKGANDYEIFGNLVGLGGDSVTIFVSHYNDSGRRLSVDTVATKAQEGRFYLKGRIDQPKFVWLQFGDPRKRKSGSVFLEHGRIYVSGNIDSTDDISVTGTPSNNDLTIVHKYTNAIYQRISTLRSQLKNEKEGSEAYTNLSQRIEKGYDSIDQYQLEFIRKHPHSYASSIFLYVKQDKLPVEELEMLFNSLDEGIRKSDMVLMIPQKISARKSVLPGNVAPDFVSTDMYGQKRKLSDFKGKYVLLEFWASWCVPCRQQSPHLVDMYRKYGPKGFTIVQYSIDDKNAEVKWKEAIAKDGLTWIQLSDLAGFDSPVTKLYGVQPIPDNFLIDPHGIIIARGLQGRDLEDRLVQLLNQ